MINFSLRQLVPRVQRTISLIGISHFVYRYRYLACFVAIGFVSIVFEIAILKWFFGDHEVLAYRLAAFTACMLFSFVLNARLNFHVPRQYMRHAFLWFAVISTLSFALNMSLLGWLQPYLRGNYGVTRLVTASLLFFIAYLLHRRFTFDQARNFGVAVYACEGQDPDAIHEKIGFNCDHLHIDLIDETMSISPAPIRIDYVQRASHLWRGIPLSLHIMSTNPRKWMDQTWQWVDWYLLDLAVEDDLLDLVYLCRQHGKKVGVVWRLGIPTSAVMPYLPHVDFVMVLGIAEPGTSGQEIRPEAIEQVRTLDRMRSAYGYELMFDGGVKPENVADIPAKYLVAASAVLKSKNPIYSSFVLRSGGRYHRRDLQHAASTAVVSGSAKRKTVDSTPRGETPGPKQAGISETANQGTTSGSSRIR